MHCYGRLDGAGHRRRGAGARWSSPARTPHPPGGHGPTSPTASATRAHRRGLRRGRRADGAARRPAFSWLQPRSARGMLRLVDDDLDGARADLAAAGGGRLRAGRARTPPRSASPTWPGRSTWPGAWDDAVVHAERAVAINIEADLGLHAVDGRRHRRAGPRGPRRLGRPPSARCDGATRARTTTSARSPRSGMARARIGEAVGDPDGVLAALEPVRHFPFRDAVDEPGFWAWHDLYAEALVALGRVEEADALPRPARASGPPTRGRAAADRPPGPGPRPGRGRRRTPGSRRGGVRPGAGGDGQGRAPVRAGPDRAGGRRVPAPRRAAAARRRPAGRARGAASSRSAHGRTRERCDRGAGRVRTAPGRPRRAGPRRA